MLCDVLIRSLFCLVFILGWSSGSCCSSRACWGVWENHTAFTEVDISLPQWHTCNVWSVMQQIKEVFVCLQVSRIYLALPWSSSCSRTRSSTTQRGLTRGLSCDMLYWCNFTLKLWVINTNLNSCFSQDLESAVPLIEKYKEHIVAIGEVRHLAHTIQFIYHFLLS